MSECEWFVDAFGEDYLHVYARRDNAAAEREVAFAVDTLRLAPGGRVLDLCCGRGLHLAAFIRRGLAASGADLSAELVRHAKAEGPAARADMRAVPFAGPFAGVTSFFTSFGYFDDTGNRRVLAEISRLLKPGGGFLIDFLSPQAVRAGLVARSERRVAGREVVEERWIEESPARVRKRVAISGAGADRCYTESVRLYELDEMKAMLASAGLELERAFGDFCGAEYVELSPRMILVGRKAGPSAPAEAPEGVEVFRQIEIGQGRNFTYVFGEDGECAIVDPTDPAPPLAAAKEFGLKVRYIIGTHGHHDHTGGHDEARRLSGAKIVMHDSYPGHKDIAVGHGQKLPLGKGEFAVLHVPGHTEDSIAVLWRDRLITGDTLFVGKVGGTNYAEGAAAEYRSLHEVIGSLPDETEVWPGHDYGVTPSSTVGREKATNPFLLQPDLESFIDLKRNWLEYKKAHGIK